jgi:transglutaminase-like putative cysteine protease
MLPNQPYPLQLDSSFEQYLRSYPVTAITPEIEELSRRIVGEATDLTDVLRQTKQWMNNHAYDRNNEAIRKAVSLVESRLTPAPEVLATRMSSCGSFATLGAALLRASGVPVRLVDGSHTTSTDHAWVEVYYPTKDQWIPFDFTGNGDPETGFSQHDHQKHQDCLDWSDIVDQLQQRHQAWMANGKLKARA